MTLLNAWKLKKVVFRYAGLLMQENFLVLNAIREVDLSAKFLFSELNKRGYVLNVIIDILKH